MTGWTPRLVEERLAEAAEVLKRLPEERVQGYFGTWPKVLLDPADLAGQQARLSRPWPSPAAISRMEETLGWTIGLDPVDGRIIWMKAAGERWKTICRTVGLQRSAAHRRWQYALAVLTLRLNGRRLGRTLSQQRVIALAAAAKR